MAVRLTEECGWIDEPFILQTGAELATQYSGVISLACIADGTY